MKLRNKKTGEIGWLETYYDDDKKMIAVLDEKSNYHPYDSLAELNDEWEDYASQEPLIKDEKIRKAVRVWADVNGISRCVCKDETHCVTFETERGMFISFENADPIPPEGNFTITELCGEDEE